MEYFCVYKHTAPNGKVYIGITCQKPQYRWRGGEGYRHNEHFHNAILKYGWDNFKHEILFENLTQAEASSKEIELIALHKSNLREFGYNIENGGYYSSICDETRQKISQAMKGKCVGEKHHAHGKMRSEEHRRHLSEALKGKTIKEETRKKISESTKGEKSCHFGKHHTEETKRKISDALKGKPSTRITHFKRVVCIETNVIYGSIPEASQKTGVRKSSIYACCNGNYKTAGGYKWRYAI